MANSYRGEIEAIFDNTPHTLVLTLGALAELEATFGAADMLALAERFQNGRISAIDATRIIGAGLRGAGHDMSDTDVGRMRTENGATGFVSIVAKLLAATFGGPASVGAPKAMTSLTDPEVRRGSAVETPDPFPGPR
jgi:hypothetical protein